MLLLFIQMASSCGGLMELKLSYRSSGLSLHKCFRSNSDLLTPPNRDDSNSYLISMHKRVALCQSLLCDRIQQLCVNFLNAFLIAAVLLVFLLQWSILFNHSSVMLTSLHWKMLSSLASSLDIFSSPCSVSSSFPHFGLLGGGPGPGLHGGLLPGPTTFPLRGWVRRVRGPGQARTVGGWWRGRLWRAGGGPHQSGGRGPGLPPIGDQLQGPGADQGRAGERHHHFLRPVAGQREPGLLCGSWHGKQSSL